MNIISSLQSIDMSLNNLLVDIGFIAPIISTILIYLESLFAFLPLVVFITINTKTLGFVLGVLVSWIFTTLGGFTVSFLCRKGFSKFFNKNLRKKKKIRNFMKMIEGLSFQKMVLIISIPLMPSFLINVCSGLSKIELKKYFYALAIGKIFIVTFWSYVGNNVIECLTDPAKIVKVILLMLFTFVLTKIVSKKLNIE